MRSHITVLLATAALSLAACGADDDAGAAGGEQPDRSTRQAMADFAECMRKHGIDFPDPGTGGDRAVRIDGDPEELREAEEACAELREKIKPPDLSDEQKAELKQAALAHSRCMREQGIDFPDPQFDADGGVTIELGRGGEVDPDDPDFRKAQEACEDELPQLRREESAP
jgi:hypothetical protein